MNDSLRLISASFASLILSIASSLRKWSYNSFNMSYMVIYMSDSTPYN